MTTTYDLNAHPAEYARRVEAIDGLFKEWDLDGNEAVGLGELLQIIQASNRKADKDTQKWVKRLEAQVEQAKRLNQSRGSMGSLRMTTGGVITFADQTGEPSLDPEAFRNFILHITGKEGEAEFDAFCDFVHKSVEDAAASTYGSKCKKEIWEMFNALDRNNDGFVDLGELEPLLHIETKSDKKKIARLRHYILNKELLSEEHFSKCEQDSAGSASPPSSAIAWDKKSIHLSLSDFQKFILDITSTRLQNEQKKSGLINAAPLSTDPQAAAIASSTTATDALSMQQELRISALLTAVRKDRQDKQVRYILSLRVHEIMNDIMEDILKEEPLDVLSGIVKSAERLKRTGKYPKALTARHLSVKSNGSSLRSTPVPN